MALIRVYGFPNPTLMSGQLQNVCKDITAFKYSYYIIRNDTLYYTLHSNLRYVLVTAIY